MGCHHMSPCSPAKKGIFIHALAGSRLGNGNRMPPGCHTTWAPQKCSVLEGKWDGIISGQIQVGEILEFAQNDEGYDKIPK